MMRSFRICYLITTVFGLRAQSAKEQVHNTKGETTKSTSYQHLQYVDISHGMSQNK